MTAGIITVPSGPFLDANGKPSMEWLIWMVQGHVTNTTGTGVDITHSVTVEPTTFALTNTGVTAGSYGDGTKTFVVTVNAKGQITALSAIAIAIANTQVSGLGTMATQNANNVSISGGVIANLSSLQAAGTFACNNQAAQASYASGGAASATPSTNTAPWGYTTAAQADGIVTLLNNIRTALVNNGIMS